MSSWFFQKNRFFCSDRRRKFLSPDRVKRFFMSNGFGGDDVLTSKPTAPGSTGMEAKRTPPGPQPGLAARSGTRPGPRFFPFQTLKFDHVRFLRSCIESLKGPYAIKRPSLAVRTPHKQGTGETPIMPRFDVVHIRRDAAQVRTFRVFHSCKLLSISCL